MELDDHKILDIAKKIHKKLKEGCSPEQCTWGEQNPEAWDDLFRNYKDDIISDIRRILKRELK